MERLWHWWAGTSVTQGSAAVVKAAAAGGTTGAVLTYEGFLSFWSGLKGLMPPVSLGHCDVTSFWLGGAPQQGKGAGAWTVVLLVLALLSDNDHALLAKVGSLCCNSG
jgi:hypothetical protein